MGFSKVVHQRSPRPCGGGNAVGNRQALACGKACGQLLVDALPRPRRSGLFSFCFFFSFVATALQATYGSIHAYLEDLEPF